MVLHQGMVLPQGMERDKDRLMDLVRLPFMDKGMEWDTEAMEDLEREEVVQDP